MLFHKESRRKIVVVALFTLAWIAVGFSRARFAGGETELDPSWALGLGAMLQQGSISGRDFQFTYGPLGQAIAWAGTLFTQSHSPFDSYPMTTAVAVAVAAVVLGVALLLMKQLTWRSAVLVYTCSALMNLFSGNGGYRLAIILLCCVAAHRAVVAEAHRQRLAWAVTTGFICFVGQLATPEVGIYGCASAVLVTALSAFKGDLRTAASLAVTVAATYLTANLALSVGFQMSSVTYESLFAYQRYALETITGYHNGMGAAWGAGRGITAVLLILSAFTIASGVYVLLTRPFPEASLLVSLLIASLFSIRSALVRSDAGHIGYAFTPMIVTFLVCFDTSSIRRHWWRAAWAGLLILLLASWPDTALHAVNDIRVLVNGDFPPSKLWNALHSRRTSAEQVLPPDLVAESDLRAGGPMLAFPYQNYIPVLLQRPLVAPVLQNYSTGTLALQEFYVEELKRFASDLDVVYGVDDVTSWPVDGVQAISRTPDVFEYLYTNYNTRSDEVSESGFYLLRAAAAPRPQNLAPMAFETVEQGHGGLKIQLRSPGICGVMKVKVRIDYPVTRALLRPNAVIFTFTHDTHMVATSYLRPIAIGQSFTTYFSTLKPADFHRLFGSSEVPVMPWDSLTIVPAPTDKLGVDPSNVKVEQIECLDSSRFVLDQRPAEITDVRFESSETIERGDTVAGYLTIDPTSGNRPELFVRFGHVKDPVAFSDFLKTDASTNLSVDLRTARFEEVGLALANLSRADTVVRLTLKDSTGSALQSVDVSLGGGNHTSRFLKQLIEYAPGTASLEAMSAQPFALLAMIHSSKKLKVLPVRNMSTAVSAGAFPHFVMYGGWGTEILLQNTTGQEILGKVRLHNSGGRPLPAMLNGVTASEFEYAIEPGETLKLTPGPKR